MICPSKYLLKSTGKSFHLLNHYIILLFSKSKRFDILNLKYKKNNEFFILIIWNDKHLYKNNKINILKICTSRQQKFLHIHHNSYKTKVQIAHSDTISTLQLNYMKEKKLEIFHTFYKNHNISSF